MWFKCPQVWHTHAWLDYTAAICMWLTIHGLVALCSTVKTYRYAMNICDWMSMLLLLNTTDWYFPLYSEHLLYFTCFLHGVHPAGHMFLVYTRLTQEEKVSFHRNSFSLCLFSYVSVGTTYSSCTIVIIFAQVEHGKTADLPLQG